ncbi:MAG: DUF2470 domain-containing protein [Proteobacteria bacterium]|nr:DUF2470 domain-containing protein [Pseudomonadota bacterium]
MPSAGSDALSMAVTARGLLRAADRGALATTLKGKARPYVSLVLLAVDHDASPLLMISDLAEHTKNLLAEPQASLLVDATQGLAEPLAGARATLIGTIAKSAEPRHRQRFLSRHPDACAYEAFHDFNVYAMCVERVHLVAGFGRIRWVEGSKVLSQAAPALLAHESEIVRHMNADHADALDLYAERLLARAGTGWRMTGIDREGCDLRREGEVARLQFDEPISDPETARATLVRLVKAARAR